MINLFYPSLRDIISILYILWYVPLTHTNWYIVFPYHKINSIFVFGNLIFPSTFWFIRQLWQINNKQKKIRRIIIFNLFLSSTFQYSNPILTISSSSIFCFSVVFVIFVYVMYTYYILQFNSIPTKNEKDVQQQASTFELLLYTLRLYFYVLACFMAFSSHLLLVYFLFYLSHSLNLFCGSV